MDMDTVLQQLYNGDICPVAQYRPLTEEYKEMQRKHYENYENFIAVLEKLTPPLHETFKKIIDEQLDTIPFEISDMFIEGFRLGARMMIEVYEDRNKIVKE